MPIYDYRCSDCGEVVERLVRSTESSPSPCPSCEGERMERLPSAGHMAHFHSSGGSTCCGREERCETPGCSDSGSCCCG
jgi:putative FmdB family regulatory protein